MPYKRMLVCYCICGHCAGYDICRRKRKNMDDIRLHRRLRAHENRINKIKRYLYAYFLYDIIII